MKYISALILSLLFLTSTFAQEDDLLSMLEDEQEETTNITSATFKGTRIINGHSVETRKKGVLDFIISHRFGEINSGAYNFFGLDQANFRLGFEYAITDRLYVGIGRNSYEKTYDGFVKYRLLQQSSGLKNMPVSITTFSSMSVKTLKTSDYDYSFIDRLTYVHQLLIARKFSSKLSLQIMPSFVHFNTIQPEQNGNDQFSIGMGGRLKLTKRVSVNVEYHHQLTKLSDDTYNAIAVGVDIETGGHVFQLQFTNATSMIEKGFISETRNNFFAGDIHFGFNISRTFQLGE